MDKYRRIGVTLESQGPAAELDALIVDTLARNRVKLSAEQSAFILAFLPRPLPPIQKPRKKGYNNSVLGVTARTLYFLSRGEPLPLEWLFAELPQANRYEATYIDRWSLEVIGPATWRNRVPAEYDWSEPLNDVERAEKLGLPRATVRKARIAAGVPSPIKRNVWTPEIDALLGTLPDAEVARRFGVSINSVRGRRRKLGKPSWKRPHGQVSRMLLDGYSVQEVKAAVECYSLKRILECQARLITAGELEDPQTSPSRSQATG